MIKEKDAAFQRSFNIEKRLLEMEQQGTIRLRKKPDGDIAIEPLGGGGGGGGSRGPGVPLGDFGQNGGFSVGPGGVTGPGGPGGPGTSLPRASEAPPPPPPPPLPSVLGTLPCTVILFHIIVPTPTLLCWLPFTLSFTAGVLNLFHSEAH